MSNELVPTTGGAVASVLPVLDVEVTAENGDEMQQCQEALLSWAKRKLKEAAAQSAELKLAFEHAVKRKWKSDTLKRHAAFALKRFAFYHKFLEALKHGYQIVPSFPLTLFAIRTDEKKPKAMYKTYSWADSHQQEAKQLPAGEGQYHNPFPVKYERIIERHPDGKPKTKNYWAKFWDEFEFPVSMAKPQIMEATSRAMALKLFDEIGICPEDPKKKDPMIVGNILFPPKHQYDRGRKVSFIIAWHLNTATI